jgi:hypothetical protein
LLASQGEGGPGCAIFVGNKTLFLVETKLDEKHLQWL